MATDKETSLQPNVLVSNASDVHHETEPKAFSIQLSIIVARPEE